MVREFVESARQDRKKSIEERETSELVAEHIEVEAEN